jgi:tetratricopeptide (TPR) repeat protein
MQVGRIPVRVRSVGLVPLSLFVLSIVALAIWWWMASSDGDTVLEDVEFALAAGETARAETLLCGLSSTWLDSPRGLLAAAQAAEQRQDWGRALKFYERLPFVNDPTVLRAHCEAADLWLSQKRDIPRAEARLLQVLKVRPDFAMAHHGLAYLHHQTGRPWSSLPHLIALVRAGNFSAEQLINVNLSGATTITLDLAPFYEASPNEPNVCLGLARQKLAAGDLEAALVLARRAHQLSPGGAEPAALLGQLLADRQAWSELPEWFQALSDEALTHPEVWMTQARWADALGQRPAAIHCGLQALQRFPNHQAANYFVGQLLRQSEESEAAAPFFAAADRLQAIVNSVRAMVAVDLQRLDLVFQTMDRLEQDGRAWEAWAWAVLLRGEQPATPGLDQRFARLNAARKRPVDPFLVQTAPPVRPPIEPARFPAPRFPKADSATPRQTRPERSVESTGAVPLASASAIQLEDRAADVGLAFRYDNGAVDASGGLMMYEFTGGGVAAFDYDLDDWPDLFFTQGGPWPVRPEARQSPATADRLFRNQAGARVRDVTESARLQDAGFGQGTTTGDLDGDGFPDLFVANIGRNQLVQNLGDGTFLDISQAAGIATSSSWSTSAALVDLNGDTFPELYVVNYLGGDDVFRRICADPKGNQAICPPQVFEAADDELFLNRGDGTFVDCSAEAGILQPDGKGLGVLVARLDAGHTLDLFIANDATPNFLFLNRLSETTVDQNRVDPNRIDQGSPANPLVRSDSLRFDEAALAAGVAVDSEGDTQACMGIAADDVDGNGLIDLLVTNFWLEPNALYLQSSPGSFSDQIKPFELYTPSLTQLGFGTQFLDLDLDGHPDLFVANGNVGKDVAGQIPYEMPPQLFRNREGRAFQELATPGAYFRGKYLGRGVARLDFNRDGRDDLAVTHLDHPAALLLNSSATTTGPSPRSLQLRCIATTSARDAIGTVVTVPTPTGKRVRQLITGDGYQARNESRLTIGLGHDAAQGLRVDWPAGEPTEWTLPELSDTTLSLIVIEGRDAPILLRHESFPVGTP